jgi:hypothetical protein
LNLQHAPDQHSETFHNRNRTEDFASFLARGQQSRHFVRVKMPTNDERLDGFRWRGKPSSFWLNAQIQASAGNLSDKRQCPVVRASH